jgi:hypothetical protein
VQHDAEMKHQWNFKPKSALQCPLLETEECSTKYHRRIQIVIDIEGRLVKSSMALCNWIYAF